MNWLDVQVFAALVAGLYVLGAMAGLIVGSRSQAWGARLALTCAFIASTLVAVRASLFWLERPSMSTGQHFVSLLPEQSSGFPALGLDLYVDQLSAFFLLLTGLLSAGVAVYSFSWLAGRRKQHRLAAFFNLFALSACMLLVVNDVYFFLLSLECITLTFGYLTLHKHNVLLDQPLETVPQSLMEDAKRAFKVYLISSHTGVILVLLAFLLLALQASNMSFDTLRDLDLSGHAVLAGAVFVLALLGFGIKAAMAPFQSWMGLTHPYLPTNVHALVSSVIIKVAGIYGMIRVFFEFLYPAVWWWGWLLLLLASLTAVVGVFYAIASRDLKTALANHSVENIGIILAGVGLALLLAAEDRASSQSGVLPNLTLAALALTAGLYHLLNHAVFKGLLFLGTGAIENRTGTVELDRLGGLIRRFPWTSATFLVGAVAIAGFPPLNGFISEWLTLQALFAGQGLLSTHQPWMLIGLFGALLMLGLSFGLTALAFVKIAGEAILGPSRSADTHSYASGDVPWSMRSVLIVLAVACLLLGLLPGLVANKLADIPYEILQTSSAVRLGAGPTSLAIDASTGFSDYGVQLSMLPILLLFAIPLVLAVLVSVRRRPRERSPVWTCGTEHQPESMQISGGAFAFLVWEWAGRRREDDSGDASEPIPWRLSLSQTRYVVEFFRRLVGRAVGRLSAASTRFGDRFQDGDIRHYLGYLFVIFVLVLLVSVLWRIPG